MYLAEKFDLMGKDPEENYPIVNLLMTLDDFYKAAIDFFLCKDESKKPEFQKKDEEKLKFFMGKFEKRYVDLGKHKYFLGDKFTLADIYLTCFLLDSINVLKIQECPLKETAPNLGELVNRIKENELKEFFEKCDYKKDILAINLLCKNCKGKQSNSIKSKHWRLRASVSSLEDVSDDFYGDLMDSISKQIY